MEGFPIQADTCASCVRTGNSAKCGP
jgi:hypothetical protein